MPEPRPSLCVACGYFVDCATDPRNEDNKPDPGDISMCLRCGCLMEFGPDMGLIALTPATRASLDTETELLIQRMERARQGSIAKLGPIPDRRTLKGQT